ncbi:MAG: hypothetical protein AAGI90_00240 [Chlamydiota bacterium]
MAFNVSVHSKQFHPKDTYDMFYGLKVFAVFAGIAFITNIVSKVARKCFSKNPNSYLRSSNDPYANLPLFFKEALSAAGHTLNQENYSPNVHK